MQDRIPQSPDGDRLALRTESIVLRPIALPLPLGYSALAVGCVLLSALHLGWIPLGDSHEVGVFIVALVAPLQAVSALVSFPGRDTQTTTDMGLISLTWLTTGLTLMHLPPGGTLAATGALDVTVAVALVAPAAAAFTSRLMPAAVIALAALHFLALGVYWLSAAGPAKLAAAAVGLLLAVVALYTALALQLEEATGRTLLWLGRRGEGREAVRAGLSSQLEHVEHAPGVRKRF